MASPLGCRESTEGSSVEGWRRPWAWGCQDRACLSLQVVLLGDHKQLRPVVKNEHLQSLGLDRSLFERYHRDAYMLDTQYRMVSRPSPAPILGPGMPEL